MQEYANTALNKLNQEAGIVLRQLALLENLTVVHPDPPMVRRAGGIESGGISAERHRKGSVGR